MACNTKKKVLVVGRRHHQQGREGEGGSRGRCCRSSVRLVQACNTKKVRGGQEAGGTTSKEGRKQGQVLQIQSASGAGLQH